MLEMINGKACDLHLHSSMFESTLAIALAHDNLSSTVLGRKVSSIDLVAQHTN